MGKTISVTISMSAKAYDLLKRKPRGMYSRYICDLIIRDMLNPKERIKERKREIAIEMHWLNEQEKIIEERENGNRTTDQS